jgi:hypothetical protein
MDYDDNKIEGAQARIIFTDGAKGDNAHIGKIIWCGDKYIELETDRGYELIPHKNIIRIEIQRLRERDKN